MRTTVIWAATYLALLISTSADADTWVVTAKGNPQKPGMDEVKAYFKLEKTHWDDGKKVILAMPELDTPEGQALLDKVYEFSKEKYKKFWLERVFRGIVPAPPETKSGDSLKKFLESYPNAIGVLPGKMIDNSVSKVVQLD